MTERQRNLFDLDRHREPEPWELDEARDQLVASIVLPVAPYGPFDYLAPDALRTEVEPGRRVRVPLGRGNRTVTGYCVRIDSGATPLLKTGQESPPARPHRLKPIREVIDDQPLLSGSMLRLTEWMADYYLCPWGQVLDAVIPAGVRGQAGTRRVTRLTAPANALVKLTQLKLPPKQAHALRTLAASPNPLTMAELCRLAGCTTSPIKALERKGLIQTHEARVLQSECESVRPQPDRPPQLNPDQQRALDAILESLHAQRHETLLVFGVTGSGKTEVYMRAIEEVVAFGRQAIVLVPEISLTPQTVFRFRRRFEQVAVLHSHLTPVERHWHWRRIVQGEVSVVVGARSAVFAPTPHLGLIVIDEEHDNSFKQDSVPRYHARDVALQRAAMEHVPVVLGSATPALESWQQASLGAYRLLELPRRVLDRPLPHVAVVDSRRGFEDRDTRGAISRPLKQAAVEALRDGGQVILLLNRRGFSTTIQCPACGEVVRCPDCDIALTHHRAGEKAVCHYCDYTTAAPANCPDCAFEGIRYAGLGTQRLEAEVRARFPDYPCLRMDSDSMQKVGALEEALARFRAGEIKILVGTQMIAKGLDFPRVTLVGVINADTALHFPDFRAAERTFQLVTQVAGRTGRGERGGRVLVQTLSPEHPAIQAAIRHDYRRFAAQELPARQQFGYPPFASMIRIVVRGADEGPCERFANQLGESLRLSIAAHCVSGRALGPAPAPIAKLRGKLRYHLLLLSSEFEKLHAAVKQATEGQKPPEGVQWVIDVDPSDML